MSAGRSSAAELSEENDIKTYEHHFNRLVQPRSSRLIIAEKYYINGYQVPTARLARVP